MVTATRPAEAGPQNTTTAPPGRLARMGAAFGRGARRARSATGRWFDAKTGHRGSTAWSAARGATGLKARRQAARDALRTRTNHRPFLNGIVALIAALFAGIGASVGRTRDKWHTKADQELNRVLPPEEKEEDHTHGAGGEEPTTGGTDNDNTDTSTTDTPHTNGTDKPTATTTDIPNTAPTSGGGNNMSGLPMSSVAADMNSAAARYAPDDMWEIVRESREWPEVTNQVALSVRTYAQKLEGDYPINQAVTDKLHELYQAIAQTGSIAQELEPLMRKAHADDIARKENARRGEEKWNV